MDPLLASVQRRSGRGCRLAMRHLAGPGGLEPPRSPDLRPRDRASYCEEPAGPGRSLVFGPGGPGDSGVDRIKTGMSRFSADLQDLFAAGPGRRTRERSASHLRRLGPRQLQLKPLRADRDRQLPDLKGRPETRYRLSRRESQSHQPRRVHETEPPSPGMGKWARRHCGNQASTRSASWTRVRLAPCSTRSVNALS